jgi:hypothetical protein
MIRYALRCEHDHRFESWFRDSATYEAQAQRALVTCPHCGSASVEKQIMAPAVASREEEVRVPVAMADQKDREMREMIRAFRQMVMANTEDVGAGFAEEARKIHYGEAEHRAIRGEASPADVRALNEEGVEVAPLPILPDDRN